MEHPRNHGWLEVITGSMFSGKSEEMIRRLRRASIAKQVVQVFKPSNDTRYSESNVASHNRTEFPAVAISPHQSEKIVEKLERNVAVIGIDEVQFFDPTILDQIKTLVRGGPNGIRVICAGLNQTSDGKPFGIMGELMAMADEITVLTAICTECGAPATKSQRLSVETGDVLVGAADKYAARCHEHWIPRA